MLTSDNRPTTEIQVVRRRPQHHHGPLAIGYWQELMTVRLRQQKAYLDDIETTNPILNSLNTVCYE